MDCAAYHMETLGQFEIGLAGAALKSDSNYLRRFYNNC